MHGLLSVGPIIAVNEKGGDRCGAGKPAREQRKLFEQLQETLPADNQPRDRGLFDKVKDYFM